MLSLAIQAIFLYALSWILWQFIKQILVKTDLDNIPGPSSESYLMGSVMQLTSPSAWELHKDIANQFGRIIRITGPLGSRYLYVFDPKALYHILVKDQDTFEETTPFIVSNELTFGKSLLSTVGEQHRKQRKMLNPIFAAANIRNMVPMFYDVANKLERIFKLKIAQGNQEIDVLHWLNRAALEMIGQAGLGYSFDSMEEGSKPHPFGIGVQSFVPLWSKMLLCREYLLPTLVKVGTPGFRKFVVRHFPWKTLQRYLGVVDTFDRVTTEIFEAKKKALIAGDGILADQIEQGKDIISILMRANMQAAEEDRLPDAEVSAQMASLGFAATETTSNALARTLYLLSIHPDIQNKLREEIIKARADYKDILYDVLVDRLPYLDAVCRETLRLYPPGPLVTRQARQDIVLPFSTPIKGIDSREMEHVIVPKGTKIFVSVLNVNRDPALWGNDSDDWKPERWLFPLPQAVYDARIPGVYSHVLTFLGGGRSCIGFKFSQLEMKAVLLTLISQFHFSLFDKEIAWEMTGVAFPTVKGVPGMPQLPLKVEVLKA